jgi:protein-S-isoprenylcysteine O-methyltransferase Ste14
MKATPFEFRFRIGFAVLFFVLGFWAPWTRYGAASTPDTTTWLALSSLLPRLGWLSLNQATLLVTWLAILLAFVGAALRLWGTAYLGTSIVHSTAMQAGPVMASGPYRYVRNPLYLGTFFFALAVSILMPPSGAAFFLVAIAVFYFRLILGEEAYLSAQLGAPYDAYRQLVPRLIPALRSRVAASGAQPRWGQSLVAEFLPWGFALCLAVLAWRYQPQLLIRCLIVCFGLSLVARALLPKQQAAE